MDSTRLFLFPVTFPVSLPETCQKNATTFFICQEVTWAIGQIGQVLGGKRPFSPQTPSFSSKYHKGQSSVAENGRYPYDCCMHKMMGRLIWIFVLVSCQPDRADQVQMDRMYSEVPRLGVHLLLDDGRF